MVTLIIQNGYIIVWYRGSGKQPPAKPKALQALQGLSNFRKAEIT
mgnify:CR=1 FL=1